MDVVTSLLDLLGYGILTLEMNFPDELYAEEPKAPEEPRPTRRAKRSESDDD